MAKKKTQPKKKYGIKKGRAFTADNGAVNDSIGRVIYVSKANPKIFLENLQDNSSLNTPIDTQTVKLYENVSNSIDCFYKIVSTISAYKKVTAASEANKVRYANSTAPTINIYKVQLPGNILTLEIRNNDPWVLTGVDSSPFDFLASIALSNSEVQTIQNVVNQNGFDASSKLLDIGTPLQIKTAGYRNFYKTTLNIIGAFKGSDKPTKSGPVSTGIVLYSIDNSNWISANYANAASSLINGPVWDSHTIPNVVNGTNPFDSSIWTAITGALNSIISAANNLPASGDGKGYRLLDTPIRDYIYSGNFDRLTFEIAFRLPFYIEDYTIIPYQPQPSKGGRINNPYYTQFENWLGLANSLRASANYDSTKLFARTGLTQSYTDAIQSTPADQRLYSLFNITSNQNLANNQISAWIAALLSDENDISPNSFDTYFTIPYLFDPKKVGNIRKNTAARAQAKAKIIDLSDFLNDGRITQSTYDTLTTGSGTSGVVWGELALTSQSPENGYYIVKEVDSGVTNYYIYNNFWGNQKYDTQTNKATVRYDNKNKPLSKYWNEASGLTISFGYDLGGKSPSQYPILPDSNPAHDTQFLYVTGLTYTSTLEPLAVQMGFSTPHKFIQRDHAVALYYTFFDSVFNVVQVPSFDYALGHILPFIKKNYLADGISIKHGLQGGLNNVFVIYKNASGLEFYDTGGIQYLNEVEKFLFITQVYNSGSASLQVSSRKKTNAYRLLQAFNSHDIRWAKAFYQASDVTRTSKILADLENINFFNHYDITKLSL
jgi:hypothetical protein